MTYPLTGSLAVFCQILQTKLETNKVSLGIGKVFYGDQNLIPSTPIACVEPSQKIQEYKPTNMYRQTLTAYILLYESTVQSPQANRKSADDLAEAVEALVHADRTLGGKVITAIVSSIESGYSTKQNTLVRASRLLVTATSQTLMTS